MNHLSPLESNPKLMLRGIRFLLSPGLHAAIESSAIRLIRHEPEIVRLRIDVRREPRRGLSRFSARGRIEIAGPDLRASVTGRDPLEAIKQLVAKLDRMLRKRTTAMLRRRAMDNIRNVPVPSN